MLENYGRLLELKDSGRRSEANAFARTMVSEFWRSPSADFVVELCGQAQHGKIHHVLWRGIIFRWTQPRLETDASAIRCLIETIQNLYGDRGAHGEASFVTEEALLRRYLHLRPGDTWGAERLITALSGLLAHAIHEWPCGVLYGQDGATKEQCQEILGWVRELRSLEPGEAHERLAADVERKTLEYASRHPS